MRILAIAEFDPAGVLAGHRDALRAVGVDYRLAVRDAYRDIAIDFPSDAEGVTKLRAFAEIADVIQFNPGIGQPWSYSTLQPFFNDGEDGDLFGIHWRRSIETKARRISYVHGSRNYAANAPLYAAHWRAKGHELWTSTLDYVASMRATYAPPAVKDPGKGVPWRQTNDPLVVVHAPTDPVNCQTAEFEQAARQAGVGTVRIEGRRHAECMRIKATCGAQAGFDHLRGCFSVNTIENCALGLVPLVGVQLQHWKYLGENGFSDGYSDIDDLFGKIRTAEDLQRELIELEADVGLTTYLQSTAREWYANFWKPEIIGPRLKRLYEAL